MAPVLSLSPCVETRSEQNAYSSEEETSPVDTRVEPMLIAEFHE